MAIKRNTKPKQNSIDFYNYHQEIKKKIVYLIFSLALCCVAFLIDLISGPAWLKPLDVFSALLHLPGIDPTTMVIVLDYRLPTALMAIGVGAALGFGGAVMQTILNNSLASPYTLGISAGAGFGAAFAIVTGISSFSFIGNYLIPVSSFIFAGISASIIYLFARFTKFNSETMILAGIGLSFLFQAMQSLMQYIATPEQSQNIVFWLFGSLSKSNYTSVAITFITLLIVMPMMLKESWKLTALKLGDERASGLGINVNYLRIKGFVCISILTGVAVCFVGTIGFVGLVGPHVARMLIGEDQRFFVPLSSLFGSILLLLSSFVSKIIVPGSIFPIGIITSIIGVPFFFSLILSKQRIT